MAKKVNPNSFNLPKYFERKSSDAFNIAKITWQHTAPNMIIDNIKKTVVSGNSPVSGQGRFDEYSTSYKKAISKGRYKDHGKKLRPINMTLTGKMMRSLISRSTAGGFVIYFTSKLAKIHSKLGAGKSKTIRKVIATDSEVYKTSITRDAAKLLKELFRRNL